MLVRVEPDAPAVWRWVVGGRAVSVPSRSLLACIADFGMCEVDGIPRLADRTSSALPPMEFLDSVAELAARHGIDVRVSRARWRLCSRITCCTRSRTPMRRRGRCGPRP